MKKSLLFAFVMLFSAQAHASLQELIDGVKQNNHTAVLQLLNAGEDVNAVNEQGNTALHYAVALNNAAMADLLLRHGADMNISNAQGWTPLKIAEKKKVENVAVILRNAQAKALAQKAKAKAEAEAAASAPAEPAAPVAPTEVVVARVESVAAAIPESQVQEEKAPEKMVSEKEVERLYAVMEKARAAVVESKKQQQELMISNRKMAETMKLLQLQNEVLTKRVAAYEDAEKAAQEEELKAKKAAEEAAEKARKAAEEAKAKQAARKAELEKNAPKPVVKKPVYKPRKSDINGNIYAGDEEIVYCLSYLGNGENTGMRRASGFFAASAGINEARYNQIVKLSDAFFADAAAEDLEKRSDTCAKIITPTDIAKQNQIIRSLNSSLQ